MYLNFQSYFWIQKSASYSRGITVTLMHIQSNVPALFS